MIVTASRQEQFEAVLQRHGADLSRVRGADPWGLTVAERDGIAEFRRWSS